MKPLNLSGQKFTRWTALSKSDTGKWKCVCDCGTEREVSRNHLRSGHSKSCGCLKSELSSELMSSKLEGQRFGKLTVIKREGSQKTADSKASSALWRCLCDCGEETSATSWKLTSGYKVSCGCAFIESITTHGKSRSRAYRIWMKMKIRCSDKCDPNSIKDYYGKGIRVCERWMKFENFIADMGEPLPSQSIDRIDPNKGYEPDNCRWASRKQQASNTTRTKVVIVNGETMVLADAIKMLRDQAKVLHPTRRAR